MILKVVIRITEDCSFLYLGVLPKPCTNYVFTRGETITKVCLLRLLIVELEQIHAILYIKHAITKYDNHIVYSFFMMRHYTS